MVIKASGGDGISAELFKILKDDVVRVLHSLCHQIWKTHQWSQDWKRSVFILIPKKGNAQEMLKLLHSCAHLTCQQGNAQNPSSTLTENFQMYKLDLEKSEEPKIKLPPFTGLWKKQENSRKTFISVSLTTLKSLSVFSSVQLLSHV